MPTNTWEPNRLPGINRISGLKNLMANVSPMDTLAKWLMTLGLILAAAGVFLYLISRIPGIGKLPGDIFIQKGNFSFYFPVVTSILLSLVLTLLFNLFKRP